MSTDDRTKEKNETGAEGVLEDLSENRVDEKQAEQVKGGEVRPQEFRFVHKIDKSTASL